MAQIDFDSARSNLLFTQNAQVKDITRAFCFASAFKLSTLAFALSLPALCFRLSALFFQLWSFCFDLSALVFEL